jgi:hypothetical protein
MCGSGQKARRQERGRQKERQQGAHEREEYHEPGPQKQTLQNLNSGCFDRFLSPEKRRKSSWCRGFEESGHWTGFATNPCL